MSKRFFGALVVAAMAMTVTTFVATPQASAGNDCAPGPVIFVPQQLELDNDSRYVTGEEFLETLQEDSELEDFIGDIRRIVARGSFPGEGEVDGRESDFQRDVLSFYVEFLAWYDRGPCNDAIAYTGPFTEMPAGPVGAYGWGAPNVVAGAASVPAGTGGGDAAAPLAHTGAESTALAYMGLGLVGFGAVALGSRRRLN